MTTDRWLEASPTIAAAVEEGEKLLADPDSGMDWEAAHEDLVGTLRQLGVKVITDDLLFVMLASGLTAGGTIAWHSAATCGAPYSVPHTIQHVTEGLIFYAAVLVRARQFEGVEI